MGILLRYCIALSDSPEETWLNPNCNPNPNPRGAGGRKCNSAHSSMLPTYGNSKPFHAPWPGGPPHPIGYPQSFVKT